MLAVQRRLRDLGHYQGELNGEYDAATGGSVRDFQARVGLRPDGLVGPATWDALFRLPGDIADRCLALTGSFETTDMAPGCFSSLAGDFDGQGLSFGALQWNIGQSTLQPLLSEIAQEHGELFDRVFEGNADTLRDVLRWPLEQQLQWARSIQDAKRRVVEPWRAMLRALGSSPEGCAAQIRAARARYTRAVQMAAEFGLYSQRGIALMFDIVVQNGSISKVTKAAIQREAASVLAAPGPTREVAVMRIIALRRADAANPRFAADVRARKMTIAEGRGMVHGVRYDLEKQFGIRLESPGCRLAA